MSLVLFDFDDTLTRVDTTLPFSVYFSRRLPTRRSMVPLLLALGLARFRLYSHEGMKRAFARRFLRGQTTEEVGRLARGFHDACLETLIDEAVLGRLHSHVSRGDGVFLISANFDCLLEPLVARWSLTGVVATKAEVREGLYSGGLCGPPCFGAEKLRRVVEQFGRPAVDEAIAYGNTDDAPLLRAVRTGFLVRRVDPAGGAERVRRWRRVLSGTLTREDLSAARTIEPFRSTACRSGATAAPGE